MVRRMVSMRRTFLFWFLQRLLAVPHQELDFGVRRSSFRVAVFRQGKRPLIFFCIFVPGDN